MLIHLKRHPLTLCLLAACALPACETASQQPPLDSMLVDADPDMASDAMPSDAMPSDAIPSDAHLDASLSDATTTDMQPMPDAGGPPRCNGFAHLCSRPFDEVSFAMTHNAHAHLGEFNELAANQTLDIAGQLALGVRGLGIKLYRTDDANCGAEAIYGYHGVPVLGCVPFADIAAPVRDFLDAHPREVLAVTVEGDASAAELADAFQMEGLDGYLHTQDRDTPWPTLGEMVMQDTRLVVFTADRAAEDLQGFQHLWSRVQDTDYRAEQFEDFDCAHDRGPADARLLLFNHFITILAPQPDAAADINRAQRLGPRIADCAAERGLPNFVYVDFIGTGDVIAVVDVANGPGDVEARVAVLRALGE
jgi:hypothetical protein